jgi:hypothetical protein
MPRLHRAALVPAAWAAVICLVIGVRAQAQDAPPAYLSLVEGVVMLERNGESEPAVRDMPFVQGDRLRTEAGRVEIQFPDGTAIEIGEYSLVEAVTPSRVRLLAGTMDHIQGRAAEAGPAMSAEYLPQDLQTYGSTFDRYGSWQYAAPHGYVWYPSVAPDWRPYHYGSWSAVPSYGWTWIGMDAWSWPTHHYGRWGFGRNAWYWIPGRTWGPAWVSWAAAADYVSWCPLGFDGRPVIGVSIIGSERWAYRDHGWNGWTVVPRGHFGARGSYAHRYAVEPRQLPSNTPFIAQSRPPVGLPHQSSVGSRQSPVGSRQSSVGNRQSPVGSRQAPVGSHQPSVAVPRNAAGVAVPRRYRPTDAAPLPTAGAPANDRRPTTTDYGVPRRAYPIATPHAPETPRVAVPEHPRMYAVPRGVGPAGVQQPSAPGSLHPNAGAAVGTPARQPEPQRWNPPPSAMPRSHPPPVQRAPAAPAVGGAPAQAAPSPPHAAPPARSAPPGAAREGSARPRSGGDGAAAGTRRQR